MKPRARRYQEPLRDTPPGNPIEWHVAEAKAIAQPSAWAPVGCPPLLRRQDKRREVSSIFVRVAPHGRFLRAGLSLDGLP